MLRIELTAEDLGRIRFAEAPAPVLETSLMLLELRQRPHVAHSRGSIDGHDWRVPASAVFRSAARALLTLAPTARYVFFLPVLTADLPDAFELVHDIPVDVTQALADRARRMNLGPVPTWMHRFDEGDPVARSGTVQALRSFHAACLAPRWPQVAARFHRDLLARTSLLRRHGVAAMLNTLSPHLRLNGLTLEGPYPWERRVRLGGHGLLLMPSAFWTAYPVIVPYDEEPARYALIYPAQPDLPQYKCSGEVPAHVAAPDPLAALLGHTRATVLRALHCPHTTTALAQRVGISPAAASTHTATLRAAGLITSERSGQAVVHRLTELGSALLWQHF